MAEQQGPRPGRTAEGGAHQTYPCPSCGAKLEYNGSAEALKCPYCGFVRQVAPADDEIREHDYYAWEHAVAGKAVQPLMAHTYKCTRCGAQVESEDLATVCSFCAAPIVSEVTVDGMVEPEGVLPFAVDDKKAAQAIRTWIGNRRFAPNALRKVGGQEQLRGTYIPFWTYDAVTATDYTGQRGEHYYTTETYTDDEGRTQTRQVMHTRWWPASGHVDGAFDDVLVCGTTRLTPPQVAACGSWGRSDAVRYRPEYLAGYTALRYDVNPDHGLEQAKEEMGLQIAAACRRDIGGDEQVVSHMNTSYSDITFKLMLMPIWIAAYLYNGKSYQVFVNARTGEVGGERPYSWVKIFFAVLAAAVVLLTLFLIFGGHSSGSGTTRIR